MIIPMKKLSLLLYHREKQSFLESLQDLGVVHIVEREGIESQDLESVVGKMKETERVLRGLAHVAKTHNIDPAQISDKSVDEVLDQFEKLEAELERIDQQMQNLNKDVESLSPWGNFEPESIERLAKAGINMRFFIMPERSFDLLDKKNMTLEVISRQAKTVYFIVIERGERVRLDAEEVTLPEMSLTAINKKKMLLREKKKETETALTQLCAYQKMLAAQYAEQKQMRNFEAARLSMEDGIDGKVLALSAWVPLNKEKKLKTFLDRYAAWYQLEEPQPGEDVPVSMKNGVFARLFEPVTKIYSLPDYFELDPTPFFAPFFAFFFGLCLGDMGYGILLLLISVFAIGKVPQKMKPIMGLVGILGFMTIVAGLLLNTFFGAAIFGANGNAGLFQIGEGPGLALLNPIETDQGTYFPAMPFSVYLGLIQIMLGMFLKGVNRTKLQGPVYFLEPLSTILMTLGVIILLVRVDFLFLRQFSFSEAVPIGEWIASAPQGIEWILLAVGFVMLILFNNPSKGFGVRFGLGFWELYNFVSGVMGDTLSYLRLFALGLAGGLLGAAFNQIAFMLVTQNGEVNMASPMIIGTIAILLLGHAINFGLAALGAFVHPLRLTYVEFYNNLNFKGGAQGYNPFSKSETVVQS
ncbi:MAG: V-type ATP synthase subunit I [Chitinivibrionales bacterium]